MHFPRIFLPLLTLLLAQLPLALSQKNNPASIVYPTSPITETTWTVGSPATITWTIEPAASTAITTMTIELGTGYNSTVINSGLFPVPAPGMAFKGSSSVTWNVPATLAPGQYCLIFMGKDAAGNTYGPSWATWFTIQAAARSATTTTSAPPPPKITTTTPAAATLAPAVDGGTLSGPSTVSVQDMTGAATVSSATSSPGAAATPTVSTASATNTPHAQTSSAGGVTAVLSWLAAPIIGLLAFFG
ncbi:hypothetical protein HDU87_000761 [Geranomyces variabilis]|uniref:Ser-Thr-rich glycosyl-phosphatidyl-inositol-anchored membrane family-domain-containing protein n=1 Tax=Geranomyces variabilis TaxID=109894 RepID=A0AAD5TN70_9FUNG|nr:hypothetical protein HDU87_000761 [Geranomyces variabilis]